MLKGLSDYTEPQERRAIIIEMANDLQSALVDFAERASIVLDTEKEGW